MAKARVLIVDDSVVIRRLLSGILSEDPEIEVVGTASNGRIALQRIAQLNPDLVTLDVEMPEMDGLATLRAMDAAGLKVPVIMFSTLTAAGGVTTLEALSLGAADYVLKPANVGSTTEAINQIRDQLVPRIRALVPALNRTPDNIKHAVATTRARSRTERRTRSPLEALVIGVSTGGPVALETMLSGIAEPLRVPVFVVQHMPALFTKMLADRLDQKCSSTVVEAEDGMIAAAGTVYIAPGDYHMVVELSGVNEVRIRLNQDHAVNYCRPAVDVLFASAAEVFRDRQMGLVLTGMGHDGFAGAQRLVEAGGDVYVQDEATSVVWGMPGHIANANLAARVLPLDAIAGALVARSKPIARLGAVST